MVVFCHRFLINHTMSVKSAGSISPELLVTSGVPQGSVLRPMLFLLYVNCVTNDVKCSFEVFADDIKLYIGLDEHEEYISDCQSDNDRLVSVSSSWGLINNVNKCKVIRFSHRNSYLPFSGPSPNKINNSCINFVLSHSDMGVTVDRTLKFHCHIAKKLNIAGNLTTNLLSCTLCRSSEFLMNLYTSHVRPKMEYCSSLWNTDYIGDAKLLD